jgi:flagellar motor switch protein FliN/FliY
MEAIGAFADVPLEIEAELDRRILSVEQILQMEPGSLIGMKRSAGENIDLYVGGVLIGCGEIVVVENSLGVRITDFNGDT